MNFPVFKETKKLVAETYAITASFPAHERVALISQIRRAAISAHLNVSEGFSRKSLVERKRFFEIARGSVIEIDTAMDIACAIHYCSPESLSEFGKSVNSVFAQLSGLISATNKNKAKTNK